MKSKAPRKTPRKVAAKPGRPTIYTSKLANILLDRLSSGESLRSICDDPKMPNRSTILDWVLNDREGFAERYERARNIGLDMMADEIMEIGDDGTNDWIETNDPENPGYKVNGEHVQRSRLRVDVRKWYLAKMAPKRYGDRQHIEHSVDEDLAKVIAASRDRVGLND